MTSLLALCVDDQGYALPLAAVEKIVRIVEITPLPSAPEIVSGVVNVHGRVIPVVNLRKRFTLREREIALNDQLIIAHTAKRRVALIVDAVIGVVECTAQDVVAADAIVPGTAYLRGVAKLKDGMILIHDLNSLLSLEEERSLDDAIKAI